jgi:hypothetical protein
MADTVFPANRRAITVNSGNLLPRVNLPMLQWIWRRVSRLRRWASIRVMMESYRKGKFSAARGKNIVEHDCAKVE